MPLTRDTSFSFLPCHSRGGHSEFYCPLPAPGPALVGRESVECWVPWSLKYSGCRENDNLEWCAKKLMVCGHVLFLENESRREKKDTFSVERQKGEVAIIL